MRCLLVALGLLACIENAFGWWMWTPGDSVDNVGYKPEQPLPFDHYLHTTKNKIPCEYCHSAARRSQTAGIPPLSSCMGCHKFVETGLDAIKLLTKHYKDNEPIKWTKVHDLPDFVRFSHKVHVLAKVTCQECHGQVENMATASQVAPLQMGWCIDCHREKKANIACMTCHY